MTEDIEALKARIAELEGAIRPIADQCLIPVTNEAGDVRIVLTEEQASACLSSMIYSHRNMTTSWQKRMALRAALRALARAAGIKTEAGE